MEILICGDCAAAHRIKVTSHSNTSDTTDFTFDVKFNRADGRVLNGSYDYIDGTGALQTGKLVEGVLTVTMKAGQTITIKDLLPGTTYEITERAHIKYTSEGTGTTGTIIAKETKTAEFVNTYLPEYADWDNGHSKSKIATELEKQEDGTYISEVTLSLPSAQENLATDVVFVLDESSAYPAVREEMHTMMGALVKQVQESGANVKVGLVEFRGTVETVELTPLTEESIETIIEAAGTRPPVGGSNMHAGLLEAKRMLEEDTEVDNHRKYMILIGDGIAYTWWKDGGQAGVNFANADSPDSPMLAGPDAWGVKYGYNSAPPSDWEEHLAEVAALLEKTVNEKSSVYDRSNPTADKPFVANAEKDEYATTTDLALFYSYQVYMQMQSKYNCFTVGRSAFTENTTDDPGQRDWDVYPYARSFMSFLQGDDENVDFTEIQKEILYLLDAGSRVEDYMGYVENDYNFDLINDAPALKMKVGETELTAEKLSDTSYGFGKTEAGYQYVLEYYPGELKAEEHFVWTINVPISNFAQVSLIYQVKLTNPKAEAGTYGQYDGDGSKGYDDLYTNNSATLYPVDSNGEPSGDPEDFNKPTVEYTVEGASTPDPTPGGDDDGGDDNDDGGDGTAGGDSGDDGDAHKPSGGNHISGSRSKSKPSATAPASAEFPLTELPQMEVPAGELEGLPKTGEKPSCGWEFMSILTGMFYLLCAKRRRKKEEL